MDYDEYKEKFLEKFLEKYSVLIGNRRAQLIPNEENPDICPECGANTKYDQDKAEIYCNDCGLVVKASIPYSGNKHIHHHYGILLQHG